MDKAKFLAILEEMERHLRSEQTRDIEATEIYNNGFEDGVQALATAVRARLEQLK